jgi:NhaP-type Na+/H+ or K+/H+ antiporter
MNQTHMHHTARPLHVGWLVAEGRRRLDDPPVEIVLSVVTGYAAYLPAERLGVSAVVAAVTAGLYVGWRPRAGLARHAAERGLVPAGRPAGTPS